MRSIVTLTTDFGWRDYYVGVLKGSIIGAFPGAQIIDLSHDIEAYDIHHGAIVLRHSFNHFPQGSIHVISVNAGLEGVDEYVFFEHKGHYFIGPNNGVFALMFADRPKDYYQIKHTQRFYLALAYVVRSISAGKKLKDIGEPLLDEQWVQRMPLLPIITANQIRTAVVHIDRFGNLFFNLTRAEFERVRADRPFKLFYRTGSPITSIHKEYDDVPVGDVVCRFNELDILELSVHLGRADQELGLKRDESVQIEFAAVMSTHKVYLT